MPIEPSESTTEDIKAKEADQIPVYPVVMPFQVWRKMTPQEYADQYKSFGRHVAVSQEVVEGCQEVWVFLGGFIQFEEVRHES